MTGIGKFIQAGDFIVMHICLFRPAMSTGRPITSQFFLRARPGGPPGPEAASESAWLPASVRPVPPKDACKNVLQIPSSASAAFSVIVARLTARLTRRNWRQRFLVLVTGTPSQAGTLLTQASEAGLTQSTQ